MNDPLMFTLQLTRDMNRRMSNSIDFILNNGDHIRTATDTLKQSISISERTKFSTYVVINPGLDVHPVYRPPVGGVYIPERYRIQFTRMRLSSHRLKIEVGRWSRLPRERRLCPCGDVQDEAHVLSHCYLTQNIRNSYGTIVAYPDVLQDAKIIADFKFIYDVMKLYEDI